MQEMKRIQHLIKKWKNLTPSSARLWDAFEIVGVMGLAHFFGKKQMRVMLNVLTIGSDEQQGKNE